MLLVQFTRQKAPGFGGVERIAGEISNFALGKSIKIFNIFLSNVNECKFNTKYQNKSIIIAFYKFIKSFFYKDTYLGDSKKTFIFHLPSLTNFLIYLFLSLFYKQNTLIIFWHCFIKHKNPILELCFKLYQLLAYKAFANLNCEIITTSPLLKEELIRRGIKEKKIYILPCCISEKEEEILLRNESSEIKNNSRNLKVIFIGRLCEYKKVDWIINIMKERSFINLDIIGSGKNFKKYKLIAKKLRVDKRIKFHGRLSDKEKLSILKNSEILILPSITPNEAFGIVQLEAMAAGIIPLATHIENSGVSWVGNISKFLNYEEINKENLGLVIDKLWSEKDTLHKCRKYSKERYLNYFARSKWEENINNFFKKINI